MSKATSHSQRWAVVALVGTIGVLGACRRGDPRVEHLGVGISKDSVITVMGGNTERPLAYLMDGQYIEALIYRRPDKDGPYDDLDRGDLTPVIVVDGRVTGWGWEHWDSVASAHRIEVDPKQ